MNNKFSMKKRQINTKSEINALKDEIRRIDRNIIDQEQNLKQVLILKNQDKAEVFRDIEEFRETLDTSVLDVKKEIVTYTLELISVIVGFLALVIAVTILWINKNEIGSEMIGIYAAIAAAFIVLFFFFVTSWILKNFLKVEGTEYKKIISLIESNQSQMRDEIESNNSHLVGYIKSNNAIICDYIDSKIFEINEFIKYKNSEMQDYINSKISECNVYINKKIIESHKYTDKKIKDALKSTKKSK